MSTNISYKGSTIASFSNDTKTLTTAGKYLEADVIVTDTSSAPSLQNKTVTPRPTSQSVTADSGYDGLGTVTVNGDANLVAGNIKKDVSIFGVTGTYEGSGGGGGWPQAYKNVTLITQNSLGTSNFERWYVAVYTNGFVEAGEYDEVYPLVDSMQVDGQYWLWIPENAWGINISPWGTSPDGVDFDENNITISGQASLYNIWDGFNIRVTGSATITISGVDFDP